MAITVGATITSSELDKTLAGLASKVKTLRPVFFRIDADVTRLLREQFATRGAALGTPWAPISPVTIRLRTDKRMLSKRARRTAMAAAGADTPLRDSGGLWASFTKPVGPWALRVLDSMTYVRGSRYAPDGVPVALLMQRGFNSTHRPVFSKKGAFFVKRQFPKPVPARPIIPTVLPAPVLKSWEGYLDQYIASGTVS